MNKTYRTLFPLLIFIVGMSFASSGLFIGNQTNSLLNRSAEFDVMASVEATEFWAEVKLNTSEINFGNVAPMSNWNSYRTKYRIKARGNIDIQVVPTLINAEDEIFSNLYFARIYESSKTRWTRIGDYSIRFNLTENVGLWSAIGSSGLMNTTTGGEQSILLDLSDYDQPIPFDETRRGRVRFLILPIWQE